MHGIDPNNYNSHTVIGKSVCIALLDMCASEHDFATQTMYMYHVNVFINKILTC